MEKQKTALCLAIEEIKKMQLSNTDISLKGDIKENILSDVIRVLENLKLTEREIIENTFEKGYENGADAYIDNPIYHGSNYFKNLTQ